MSEERPVFAIWRFAEIKGKKPLKIELFKAELWRFGLGPGQGNVFPVLPCRSVDREKYYSERYRLRINGRMYRVGVEQFTFLTMKEVVELAESMICKQ